MFVEGKFVGAYNQRIVMLIGFNIILAVSLQLINGFSGQFSLGHAGFMAVGAYLAAYPAINLSHKLNDPVASLWFFITLAIFVGIVGTALFLLFTGIRMTRKLHPSLPVVTLILLLAWVLVDFARAANYVQPPPHLIWTSLFGWISQAFDSVLTHGQPIASKVSLWFPEASRRPICFV